MNNFCFVLIPFSAAFDRIYSRLILPPLSRAGFQVHRADTLTHHQSILRDIVVGISDADLIVADLTDLNPNVMYELGIAHALGKRVVMITQSIESVPFDLRAYRMILYSTSFDQAEELSNQLENLGKGVLSGSVSFGNPVSDFASLESSKILPVKLGSANEAEFGIFELIVEATEASNTLSRIFEEVSDKMGEYTLKLQLLSEKQSVSVQSPDSSSALPALLEFSSKISVVFDEITAELSYVPDEVSKALDSVESVSLALFDTGVQQLLFSSDEAANLSAVFIDLIETGISGVAEIDGLVAVIQPLRRISRPLNRSIKQNLQWWLNLRSQYERLASIGQRVRDLTPVEKA